MTDRREALVDQDALDEMLTLHEGQLSPRREYLLIQDDLFERHFGFVIRRRVVSGYGGYYAFNYEDRDGVKSGVSVHDVVRVFPHTVTVTYYDPASHGK